MSRSIPNLSETIFLYIIFRDDSLCKIIPHSGAIFNKTDSIKLSYKGFKLIREP
jgi:hypothetical protein